uniref:SH3 domain binding protein 1 n=1 Tax=Athene cunicularia TaxID=194338 RepID=A0A663MI44_ATHCN
MHKDLPSRGGWLEVPPSADSSFFFLHRAQEATELLPEDLMQIEQRIEPAKRAAHNVSKRLQACLQGQCGSEMDKRVKKLPLMVLSMTMAESFKELDTESSLGKALEMGCCIQSSLAKILAEFEIALEHDVLQPLNRLSEEELPIILKRKKTLQKLISDWNIIKSRLNQAAKSSSYSTGAGTGPGASSAANKLEILREEEEEVKRKVEQCKNEYMADLYHFSTKEDSYASYFIRLLEIQAQYHRQSLGSLDSALAELKESHSQSGTYIPVVGYYGVPLETHLKSLGREIALPIEACVMMLLTAGMKEEGLFRLAAGASVLKKLKSSLGSGSNALEEFYSDPHAVAGALKSYLRELPQPLMTFELYNEWVKVASLKDVDSRIQSLRDTCSHLPQESYNNLRYLIKFLAKLAEHQEVNKMTPSNIAIVLGPNLLWSQQSTGDPMQLDLASVSSIQVVGVVEALIQNADSLFPGGRARTSVGLMVGLDDPKGLFQPKRFCDSLKSWCAGSPVWELVKGQFVCQAACSPLPDPRPAPLCSRERMRQRGPQLTPAFFPGKRPAPARPMMPPPPVAQPRSMAPSPAAPKHTAIPKARPRRMVGAPSRAPSVPPPLPPQPAHRHSRDAPLSPRTSTGDAEAPATMDCAPGAADEGQPLPVGGRSPVATSPPAGLPTEN